MHPTLSSLVCNLYPDNADVQALRAHEMRLQTGVPNLAFATVSAGAVVETILTSWVDLTPLNGLADEEGTSKRSLRTCRAVETPLTERNAALMPC